jgi:hypothetical protein
MPSSETGHRPTRLPNRVSFWILRALIATRRCGDTPRVLPKSERNRHGVYVGLAPPGAFVTLAVKLAMVDAAQRHRELIRYAAAECARLCEAKMVSLAGLPPAHGARLNGNEAKMIFVTTAA